VNKDQKAAVVERVASEIEESGAVFAVDYRGISVKQASDLRDSLREAGASFRIVKNTLTELAADRAGADHLKPFLEGPTALTFVRGDVALAAKAVSRFRRENNLLEWKGGQMDGQPLTADDLESIARLPAVEVLHGQLVGTIAAPLNGLVRGLASMISGLASQLQQISEQGLVAQGAATAEPAEASAGDDAPSPEEDPTEAEAPADAGVAEEAGGTGGEGETETSDAEAPGDPVSEGEAAEAPSEGEETGTEEGENA
jgi:large subunit ribosomal protein L10